MLLYIK